MNIKYCIIGLISMVSCTVGQNERSGTEINIDINSITENADEFIDSCHYLILDNRALISEIRHIDVNDSVIAINSGHDIFIFDHEGRLQSSFNHHGQGAGDYLQISDMKIHDGLVYILSILSKSINVYSPDGQFVESYKLPDAFNAFTFVNDKIWLASVTSNDTGYELAEYDIDSGSLGKQVLPFSKNQNFLYRNPIVMQSGDKIYATRKFDMSIYEIDTRQGVQSGKWTLQFNTPMQLSDFNDMEDFAVLNQATANKPVVTQPGLICVTDSTVYITADIFYKIGYFTNIYRCDRNNISESGNLLRLGLTTYNNYPFLRRAPLVIYDRFMVSALDVSMVLTIAENLGIDEFSERELSDDSNPVLFFHRLRI
ncbi:MAG: 6-bladed beta-propeller [Clostridiales bacterium]|nr:6-bladed beta-propeller [Clostridiales bacterium]